MPNFGQIFDLDITFEVTQENIENGVQFDSLYCPISLAIKDRLSSLLGKFDISVDIERCTIFHDNGISTYAETYWINFPSSATQFIIDFDNDKPVQPFSFSSKLAR